MKFKFPMKPTDPTIVVINYIIGRMRDDLNSQLGWLNESLKPVLESGDRMTEDETLVTYETPNYTGGGRGVETHQIDQWIRALERVKFLENEIGNLVRLKLALFNDVDFRGGEAHIKQLNSLMALVEKRTP